MRIAVLGLLLRACSRARRRAADTTYTVYYCRGPAGQAASATVSPPSVARRCSPTACPGGGLVLGPAGAPVRELEGMGISTRSVQHAARLLRALPHGRAEQLLQLDAASRCRTTQAGRRENCWTMGSPPCSSLGDGQRLARLGASAPTGSTPPGWRCGSTATRSRAAATEHSRGSLRRLDAVLADRRPVFTGTPSGDLLDTARPSTGVRTCPTRPPMPAAALPGDAGGRRGKPTLTRLVDDNGGRTPETGREVSSRSPAGGPVNTGADRSASTASRRWSATRGAHHAAARRGLQSIQSARPGVSMPSWPTADAVETGPSPGLRRPGFLSSSRSPGPPRPA